MDLTSRSLAYTCVAAALVMPFVTLVLWSRVRGPSPVRVTQRLALLVACQLAALAMVGTMVNNSFYLYASWNDLLGSGGGGVSATNAALPTSARAEGLAVARLAGTMQSARTGLVLNQTIAGRSHLKAAVLIYLPPQYFQPAYRRTRFPVSLVMPGYPGDPRQYLTQLNLPRIMQKEVRAGRAKPFIAVIVNETVAPPRDTECANVVRGPQVETFLAIDIRRQINRTLRTRADRGGWAMMGDSTGAFCSLKMVMRHPGTYIQLSSIISPTGGHNPGTWNRVLPAAVDYLSTHFSLPSTFSRSPAASPSRSPTSP